MPFDFKASINWAKAHPWEAGGLVFVIGAAAFFLLARQGGGGSEGGSNFSAFVAAQTAQNAQDNALALAKAQIEGATSQAQIAATRDVTINQNWGAANQKLAETNANAAQKASILDAFSRLANNLGTVLTGSKSSSSGGGFGFNLGYSGFGVGLNNSSNRSSSESTQTLVRNDYQGAAVSQLSLIASDLFHPGH